MSLPEATPAPIITVRTAVIKIVFSLFLVAVFGVINALVTPVATLVVGQAAGDQFANNDATYLRTYWTFTGVSWASWVAFFVLVAILIWVWWKPAERLISAMVAAAAACLVLVTIAPQSAEAYFNKTDWPEIVFILPNESAFYVPDVGANKDSQAAFGSEAYMAENKIAAKRFQIPHIQLKGSSYGFDYYVPAGRLIIVDRTPYAREWTKSATRGTGENDQALQCQSSDGLDIDVEIALSASVFEQNAARFLYRFGVKPPVGDRNTDEVKFVSVFQGKSLTEVMDTVVHGKIQGLICKYFADKTLDAINLASAKIMEEAETETKKYLLEEFGITLDYIGWGGTFGFSATVQKALDDKYAADKISPVMVVLERQAQIKIQEGIAQGIRSFGEGVKAHGLPSNLVAIPENLMGFSKMFAPTPVLPLPVR